MGLTEAHVGHRDATRKRFTVDEVLRLELLGAFVGDERIELLDGELWVVIRQGPRHSSKVSGLGDLARNAFGEGFIAREEKPLVAGEWSLPEPDVAVFRGCHDDFAERHPRADEAVLVIEVAVTSQSYDQRKVPIYAAARAQCLWLLDIPGRKLQVYSSPTRTGRYRSVRTLTEADSVELPVIGVTLRVADLLPRAPAA